MLKDSQFSHILILLVLGYLIFYMTCPETNSEPKESLEPTAHTAPKSVPEPVGISEHFGNESTEEVSAQEIVDAITEDSPVSESEVESPAEDEAEDEAEFLPNDENNNGANVETAFDRNVPNGVDTNAIDFNKNVLKKYDSKNYLPKEVNDKWFDTDFTQAKFKMNNDKLINTDKYVVGADTVGQSLKNATWDLRGTIANPKYKVSPWNNSTYEPDYNLKALC